MATKSPPCWTMVTSLPLFSTIDQTPAISGYSPVVRHVGFEGARGFSFVRSVRPPSALRAVRRLPLLLLGKRHQLGGNRSAQTSLLQCQGEP